MRLAAIVLAGGLGARVRSGINKVFLPIRDRAVVDYSVRTFQRASDVSRIVIAVRPEDRHRLDHLTGPVAGPPLSTVAGGVTRHQSEVSAIEFLATAIEAGAIDLIAIHDGARPFMTFELLDACIEAAVRFGGAVPGMPPEAPLYRMEEGAAVPLDGDALIRVQTPQVFKARPLLDAYRASGEAGFEGVDTAETMEKFGTVEVAIVPADERNMKVTFVEDLFRAEELATNWDDGRWRR
ncbi:MAG TPA: IspD/TarI family cytidylyltransferase [Acidimicrobiia bacterium]|nr:IspD/TarI family cytidylyltransferase [Acidimicrobiia bacterium]